MANPSVNGVLFAPAVAQTFHARRTAYYNTEPAHEIALKTLLIIYHSVTGGTRQLAEACAAAAAGAEREAITRLLTAPGATTADLLAADGYIFATPENLAAMSGLMKDFFDRCYYPALDHLNGRPYASVICAGSDGANAARQIERITTGWRLRAIAPPLIVRTGAQTPAAIAAPKTIREHDLQRCKELGAAFAAGLAGGIF